MFSPYQLRRAQLRAQPEAGAGRPRRALPGLLPSRLCARHRRLRRRHWLTVTGPSVTRGHALGALRQTRLQASQGPGDASSEGIHKSYRP